MIEEGFELMLVGMGVVFAFLILLVGVMILSGAFFKKYAHWFPEPEVVPVAPSRAKLSRDASAKIAVALASAYRNRH